MEISAGPAFVRADIRCYPLLEKHVRLGERLFSRVSSLVATALAHVRSYLRPPLAAFVGVRVDFLDGGGVFVHIIAFRATAVWGPRG
jgi:hypothetical protein